MRKLGIVFFYLIVASCVADSATTPKSRPVTTVINEPQTAEILSPPSGSRPVKAKQITASQRPRKVRSERRSKAVVSASLSQKQSPGGNGNWVIQLASVRNETQARREWRRLLGRYPIILYGKEPMIVRANLRERGVFYRLKVGGFERKGTALIACTDIRASGGRCLALRRRGQNATRSNLCAHSTVNSFTRRTGGKNPPAQASVAKANALTTQKNSALSEVSKLKSALVVARGEAGQRETRLAKFAEIELAREATVQERGKVRAAKNVHDKELRNAVKAAQALRAETKFLRKILAAENQQWNETEAALTSALKIELAAANEEIARLSAALGKNRKR